MYRSSNFQPNNTLSITPQWNNLICYLCKQPGHIKRNCPNSFSIPTYSATRTQARAAQETPYERNEDDIKKRE
ncbi:13372_t:CDS:2 [Funneliformis geosporum]|nr:13372_t:CDS:2 [Funneliformis geosporum]